MTSQKGKQFLVGYKNRMPILPSYKRFIVHLILSKNGVSYCHGTNHSRGVLILRSDKLQFELNQVRSDTDGRYVLTNALIRLSFFVAKHLLPKQSTRAMLFLFMGVIDTGRSTQYP